MQMVRTCPHVGEDQRPEVDDGQAVGIDRTLDLFRHEVIHDAEEAGSEEEAHRVVAVPPLHHRILHARIGRVGLHHIGRNRSTIDDMQQGDGDNESAEEPVGHVNMLDLAFGDGAEENNRVGNPDDGDQDIDRPFQFCVFLALGKTQRQRYGCRDNDQLPGPERERCERAAKQAGLTGTLHDIVGRCEQGAAAEGENHSVGVERPQSAETGPGQAQVQFRNIQLGRNDHADKHAHYAPDNRHDGKLPYNGVVVHDCFRAI